MILPDPTMAEMTATPSAPAWTTSDTRSSVIPPMAKTGNVTAALTVRMPSSPTVGLVPVFVPVGNTGPNPM